MLYRNQNTERSPRLPRKYIFRAEYAAVYLLGAGHSRRRTVCRLRLFHLPRYDRRTSALGMVQVRNPLPQETRVQIRQLLLRSHTARHSRGHEAKERFAYEEKFV